MLTVRAYGEGDCFWCARTTEGVEIQSPDGSLFLCKRDFWAFLKKRSQNGQPHGDAEQLSQTAAHRQPET